MSQLDFRIKDYKPKVGLSYDSDYAYSDFNSLTINVLDKTSPVFHTDYNVELTKFGILPDGTDHSSHATLGADLTEGGLYGLFVSGSYRSTLSQGNFVSLPMSSPTLYTSISYGSRGDNYSFMAIGYFFPPTTGTYTFYTSSDDGSGAWIGDIASAASGRTTGNAIVNNDMGSGHGNQERSGSISLEAGRGYPIRIVHEEGTGGDNLTFSWAGPSISKTTDLSSYFYYPGNYNFYDSDEVVQYQSFGQVIKVGLDSDATLTNTLSTVLDSDRAPSLYKEEEIFLTVKDSTLKYEENQLTAPGSGGSADPESWS